MKENIIKTALDFFSSEEDVGIKYRMGGRWSLSCPKDMPHLNPRSYRRNRSQMFPYGIFNLRASGSSVSFGYHMWDKDGISIKERSCCFQWDGENCLRLTSEQAYVFLRRRVGMASQRRVFLENIQVAHDFLARKGAIPVYRSNTGNHHPCDEVECWIVQADDSDVVGALVGVIGEYLGFARKAPLLREKHAENTSPSKMRENNANNNKISYMVRTLCSQGFDCKRCIVRVVNGKHVQWEGRSPFPLGPYKSYQECLESSYRAIRAALSERGIKIQPI
jgi:hypothetical protein